MAFAAEQSRQENTVVNFQMCIRDSCKDGRLSDKAQSFLRKRLIPVIGLSLIHIYSTTFPTYLANMRQQTVDKLQSPDVVIFNRCDKSTDKTLLHRSVRMVNRRAQILFEYKDGSIEPDDTKDPLPYDLNAPVAEIKDEDYGIFYLDVFDRMKEYEGKTVRLKAYVCQTDKVDDDAFIAGRFCMTCCAEAVSYTHLAAPPARQRAKEAADSWMARSNLPRGNSQMRQRQYGSPPSGKMIVVSIKQIISFYIHARK